MSSFLSCPEDIALHILWMLGLDKVGLMSMFTLISTNKAMRVAWTPFLREILPFCPDAFLCTTRLLVSDGERSVFEAAISKVIPSKWSYTPPPPSSPPASHSPYCPKCKRWDDLYDVMHDEIFPIFLVIAAFHDNTDILKCMIEGECFGICFEMDIEKIFSLVSKGYLRRTILLGDFDSALKACGKDWYPFDIFDKDSNNKFVYERPHIHPSLPFQRAPPYFVDIQNNGRRHDIICWLMYMAENLAFSGCWPGIDHMKWAMRTVKDAKTSTAHRLLQVATKLIEAKFWFDIDNVNHFVRRSRFVHVHAYRPSHPFGKLQRSVSSVSKSILALS